MKKMYLILLVFVINSIVCFGSEQIELSTRLGKTISLDSRNYFGLFPDVKDYKSAVLFKDVSINYIEITAGKSEKKSKIILSDSAVSTLAYVIDNFEGIISEPAKYKLNGKLISGLIRVSTQFNKKAKPVIITLRDSTKFSGFILYADSSVVVTTPDSAYRAISANLKITGYSDIYSISNVDYPIIDGTKEIFVNNKESFLKIAIFTNLLKKNFGPPEILKLVKELPLKEENKAYESILDFERLYFKRTMVSIGLSFQEFNLRGLQLNAYDEKINSDYLLSNNNYFSFGLNYDYKLTKNFTSQIGIEYENQKLSIGKANYDGNLTGKTLHINLFYNILHDRIFEFEIKQTFVDVFGEFQVHWYKYSEDMQSELNNDYYVANGLEKSFMTENEPRFSYKGGIRYKYRFAKNQIVYLLGFVNYHDDYGIITFNRLFTRYIHYMISYGLTFGIGIEL